MSVASRRCGRRRVARRGAPSGGMARTGPVSSPGDAGALVPGDAQPVEPVEDVLLERLRAAGDVRVLEPEHERAAGVAGEQVVEQRRPRGPEVERPGGARRDPDADVGSHAARPGARGSGTWWNSAGSASPSRTRMSAAGRSPRVARPRGPSSVSESRLSDRARTTSCAPGRERPRLEVGQQPGVLLGLLGDPEDRRLGARLQLGQRDAGRAAARRSRGRWGCRAGTSPGGRAARRASTRPAARARPGGASPRRRSPPTKPDDGVSSHSRSAWRRKIRPRPRGPRVVSTRPRPVGGSRSPSEASRRHISLAACVDTPTWRPSCAVVATRPCRPHDAEREEVLLGGGRDVRTVAALHPASLRCAGGASVIGRWRGRAPHRVRAPREADEVRADDDERARGRRADPRARPGPHGEHGRHGQRDGERHDDGERRDGGGRRTGGTGPR